MTEPGPSRLDRLIAWASPSRGLARARARAATAALPEMQRRFFEAARASRQTYGWLAGFTSANAETWGGIAVLRARSRELVRNNPHARKAIASLVNNCVGNGIQIRAKTQDEGLNKRINKLFYGEFAKRCDVEGHYHLAGLQKVAMRAFFEGGEAVLLRRPQPSSSGLKVPVQYQVVEGDFIDHNKNLLLDDGGRIVQGVETGRDNRRRAYWMFSDHPGDAPFIRYGSLTAQRVPADGVIHLYEKERPGQTRGVAWLYAAMVKLKELETYEEAELVRKRLEACFAGFVVNPEAMADPATGEVQVTPGITDLSGNKVEAVEPGMLTYLRGGSDIKFASPTAAPGYADYKRSQLHSVSAGALITYELLTGDLSHVNYSSIRAGMLEYRRLMSALQWSTVIPVMLEPVWRDFIDFAVAAGELPADTPYDATYAPPVFESVDPLKDNLAAQMAVRSLFQSQPDAIAEQGYDPDEVLEEQAAFLKKAYALGLVLDTDPSKVARTGVAQQTATVVGEQEGAAPAQGGDAARSALAEELHAALKRAGLNGSALPMTRQILAYLESEGSI